ncbi:MAG TPA: 5-formyltetrahydrofolate cyclo-ligase [Burkholderiaceae bacterium]|nr:5-formyltetrahydrofolate cyclo-ligase [Burkholderiaceae bacterium]
MTTTLARTPEDKPALRRTLIEWRNSLSPDVREAAERSMSTHLIALATQHPIWTVAAYWPMRGEPRLDAAWQALRDRDVALALPAVVKPNAPMEFRLWQPDALMTKDECGVPTPLEAPVVNDIDVLVVPCVGYHPRGYRLGYGGGYFDRTLITLRPAPYVIGVAFSGQLCRFTPDPHDVPLDAIVTERGGLMLADMAPRV